MSIRLVDLVFALAAHLWREYRASVLLGVVLVVGAVAWAVVTGAQVGGP